MLASNKYSLAAAAAVLAATAFGSWHRNGAEIAEPTVQVERSPAPPAALDAESAYLPALFEEEEKAARAEPLPPQF